MSARLNRRRFGILALSVFAVPVFLMPGGMPAQSPLDPSSGTGLSVVTLNIAMQTNPGIILREMRESAPLRDPDVLLLQEVVHAGGDEPSVAESLAKRMGYHVLYGPSAETVTFNGLAILSRHPIGDPCLRPLKTYNLHLRSRSRIALGATIKTPTGPVRVYNVHLDTRINAGDRIAQLAPIVEEAREFDGPALIGGDFNTNNNRWIASVLPLPYAQVQTSAVRRMMASRGFMTPFAGRVATHDFLGMRLDWLFVNGLETRAHGIQPMRFSDHHAVWVRVTPDTRRRNSM